MAEFDIRKGEKFVLMSLLLFTAVNIFQSIYYFYSQKWGILFLLFSIGILFSIITIFVRYCKNSIFCSKVFKYLRNSGRMLIGYALLFFIVSMFNLDVLMEEKVKIIEEIFLFVSANSAVAGLLFVEIADEMEEKSEAENSKKIEVELEK